MFIIVLCDFREQQPRADIDWSPNNMLQNYLGLSIKDDGTYCREMVGVACMD